MTIKHLRRPRSRPEGPWWLIGCDCGWTGQTPDMSRTGPQIDAALEHLFRQHLPDAEARTHLLVDAREPEYDPELAEQPKIVGTFIMPMGEPTMLLRERIEDGVHIGVYVTSEGGEAELPIGEVRTPDGRVFRLDE